MNLGYSHRLVVFLKQRAATQRGSTLVKLGLHCVAREIPVADLARDLGVSRQTVYNWFWGKHEPNPAQQEAIEQLYARLKADAVPT